MHYFVSDLHLRSKDEKNYQIFLSFLRSLRKEGAQSLFLLGDIFDLWVANHKCFVETYQDIVSEIQNLVKSGTRVCYFEGNHDLYLKKFWQEDLGCQVYLSDCYIELDGLVLRLEHGDLANPEDKKYLAYRKLLRTPLLTWLAYRIPGKWIQNLGLKASTESRKTSNQKRIQTEQILDKYVQHKYKEKPFDVFISGHFHSRIDKTLQVEGGKVRNINLGWWQEEQLVLVLNESKFSWLPADR